MNNDTKLSSTDTTRFDDANADTIWDPRAELPLTRQATWSPRLRLQTPGVFRRVKGMDDDGDVDASDETLYDAKYSDWSGAGPPVDPRQAFSDKGNPFMPALYVAERCQGFQGIPHFALDTASSATEGKLMLNHHRARFADPVTGRWTTRDPLGPVDSANLYSYLSDNPPKYPDPSGNTILAIGGATSIGDPAFYLRMHQLADTEQSWYQSNRACTNLDYPEILEFRSPTGPNLIGPDWQAAESGLVSELYNYLQYRENINWRRDQGECVCPQYLHIIGFSDGASTIARWLNHGAQFAEKMDIGVIGLIDMVRDENNHFPINPYNVTWGAERLVNTRSLTGEFAAKRFENLRNFGADSGSLPFSAGFRINPEGEWNDHPNIGAGPLPPDVFNLIRHEDFPGIEFVPNKLSGPLRQSTSLLASQCSCCCE